MSATSERSDYRALLKDSLIEIKQLRAQVAALEQRGREPIAIVGMGCRFPGGVDGPESFWELLRTGGDAIGTVPSDRWDIDAYYDPDPDVPGKMSTRFGGFLDRVDLFDASFFGIAPREAAAMDPQQRLLLEVAWEALEYAGVAPDRLHLSRTGVFVGMSNQDYTQLFSGVGALSSADVHFLTTGTAFSVAAGRLSYVLGLQGPSMAVDTACSSSLMAVHLACQSLRAHECDMALAGGVSLILAPESSIAVSSLRMSAPDGRCKTFDAAADGYVRGEGCGLVVLKRLSDARRDGDSVLAVIRGSAVNQDGRSGGLTAPNGPAQQSVIRAALACAGVVPAQVGYVEAHGTGTALGDPTEVRALGAVLGEGRAVDRPLMIGSVKTNVGHLESAAGVAGLMKVVLALQHAAVPAHLHLKTLNPHIVLDDIPAVVPTRLTPWLAFDGVRTAGVSSFGFSGTNVHVVVEEEGVRERVVGAERPLHLLVLSARSVRALDALVGRYEEYLVRHSELVLADICHTAASGRTHFAQRAAFLVESPGHLCELLAQVSAGEVPPGVVRGQVGRVAPRVAFLFTGQGAQYVGMGRELYATQPVFRAALDRCAELLLPILGQDLRMVLYPPQSGGGEDDSASRDFLFSGIDQTGLAQPALFAVEYALAQLWRAWGVEPVAVLGHSLGEYVAACVAGVFGLEDALRLVVERARLMQALPDGGAMAAVFADEACVVAAIGPYAADLSVAAFNGPAHTVISGRRAVLEVVLADFARQGVQSRWLRVSHAFHSPLMDAVLPGVGAVVRQVVFSAPQIRLVSNLSGRVVQSFDDPVVYWSRHLREPVRFMEGLHTLRELGVDAFVEIGPHPVLLALGQECVFEGAMWLPSLRRGHSDWRSLLESLGRLYVSGATIDWFAFDRPYASWCVPLPTYPFQRERHWLDVARPGSGTPTFPDLGERLYELVWVAQDRPVSLGGGAASGSWLLLSDSGGVAASLAVLLRRRGVRCWLVEADDFAQISALLQGADPPERVVYLRGLDAQVQDVDDDGALGWVEEVVCGGALGVIQVLARAALRLPPRLWLVTCGAQPVAGVGATGGVFQSLLWGLGRTLSHEHPELWGGLVDLDPRGGSDGLSALVDELFGAGDEDQVGLRDGVRYVARLVACGRSGRGPGAPNFGSDGSYLVTGGTRGLGLLVAEWMIAGGARCLVLVGRGVPAFDDEARIGVLRARGAQVVCVQADVSRRADVEGVLAQIRGVLPPLRGVVHCAGVLDDGVLLQQDWGRFSQVLAPKVRGAWHLHALLSGYALDFMVFFSSVAALFGSPGQGGYAAGNAFLDALACQRRAQGMVALSVGWGPWAEVGMAARVDDRSRRAWAARGVRLIVPAQGLRVFGALLAFDVPHVGVIPADWSVFLSQVPDGRARSFFADVFRGQVDVVLPEVPSDLVVQLGRCAGPSARLGLLIDYVRAAVVRVLGLPAGSVVDLDVGFADLGFDSLMAIELRNMLQVGLACAIPSTAIFNYPTIEELSAYLIDQVLLFDQGVSLAQSADGLIDEVAALSEDEMAAFIAAEVARLMEGSR